MNRAWTFIINKELSPEELSAINSEGKKFIEGWTAHESKLSGNFEIFQNRIIIIKVNEEVNAASGCSIDKLTRFIKQIESSFSVELMNRLLVAYLDKNDVKVVHSSLVKQLLMEGTINENTIILNTALSNQDELQNLEQPLKKTWLQKFLPTNV